MLAFIDLQKKVPFTSEGERPYTWLKGFFFGAKMKFCNDYRTFKASLSLSKYNQQLNLVQLQGKSN